MDNSSHCKDSVDAFRLFVQVARNAAQFQYTGTPREERESECGTMVSLSVAWHALKAFPVVSIVHKQTLEKCPYFQWLQN
ncbi:hypothetical protein M514_11005 [Trichuris suis]|uniref:Uncharacterized protein n=1 Tax=Trichuris suis TaxID=68888 RepID=A0A085LT28_9BILA|nr:hypothetical protein M513_11005 [Trichuris suis]KFD61813.1 hypothetical protein M514_11005 [Trichuris suis]